MHLELNGVVVKDWNREAQKYEQCYISINDIDKSIDEWKVIKQAQDKQNEEEHQARIAAEHKQKAEEKEAAERKEYERLTLKFKNQ
jgi:hypothetical protein